MITERHMPAFSHALWCALPLPLPGQAGCSNAPPTAQKERPGMPGPCCC